MISININHFARWLIKYDANTLRLWALLILIGFWGAVTWTSCQVLGTLGVMFQ